MPLLTASRKKFHELIESFPEGEKVAYVEAQKRAPHLISLESNPDYYLESSNYDAYSAARRVIEYWTVRKAWFGERAFLPMTLNGEGALSSEDIDVLNTGFMMLLPEDKHGRAVAFHDRARLTCPEVMDVNKRKRCIFYVLSVAGESESCRKNGLVFLSAFCDKTRKSTFDLQMLADKVALMKHEALPYHFVGLHIVMLSQRPILNMVVPMTVQAFEKMDCLKRGIVVHSRKPTEALLEDFKRHGFDPESIPKVPFGGFWTLGCFKRWLEDRKLKEKKVYDGESAEETDGDHHEAGEDVDREQLRKKRKMGAAYARRKRARNKIEVEVMQNEVERLKKQQESLEMSGDMLEQLIAEANAMVERIESAPGLMNQATARNTSTQGATSSIPMTNSNNNLGVTPSTSSLDPVMMQQAAEENEMRLLRQFMTSLVQPDLSNHFSLGASFPTRNPSLRVSHPLQPVSAPPPVVTSNLSNQLLMSLLAAGAASHNLHGTYADSTSTNMGGGGGMTNLPNDQENVLLRTLRGAMGNDGVTASRP